MLEEAGASMTCPVSATAWTDRLAATLVAEAQGIYEPALEALRESGLAPAGPFAPAAVLVAIVEESTEPGVLLTRRRDHLARHGGQVAFPGGAVDAADESAQRAALREAEEEVALAPERVRVLGSLPRYPTRTGYLIEPVVGYVAEMPALRAQPAEVAEIFIVPLAVLLDSARWQAHASIVGKRSMPPELSWTGRRIWGITAGILQLLIPLLREARS